MADRTLTNLSSLSSIVLDVTSANASEVVNASVNSNPHNVSQETNAEFLTPKELCQQILMQEDISSDDDLMCPRVWDGMHCWPPTVAGVTVEESCSTVLPLTDEDLQEGYRNAVAFRRCNETGAWDQNSWTNYSQCLEVISMLEDGEGGGIAASLVPYITFIGSLASLLMLLASLFIFLYFRSLECDRLRVHRNLLLALLLQFIAMIVIVEPYITGRQSPTYKEVDWLCRALISLKMFGHVSSIMWMFVEGLFLHSRLTCNVFDSAAPFKFYYSIGWGVPLLLIICWCTVMHRQYQDHCWHNFSTLPYIWILEVPMLLALLINLLFLINIIRILVTKLRTNDSAETIRIKKAIRATIILFQLLGITNLLFAFNLGPKLKAAYMITNAILQSSQGIIVSSMYCFLNTEVRELVRKRWRQYCIRQMGVSRPPTRMGSYYNYRKSTFSTIVLPATFTFSNRNAQSNLQATSTNISSLNQPMTHHSKQSSKICKNSDDGLNTDIYKIEYCEMQIMVPKDFSSVSRTSPSQTSLANVEEGLAVPNGRYNQVNKHLRRNRSLSRNRSILGKYKTPKELTEFGSVRHDSHKQCYPDRNNCNSLSKRSSSKHREHDKAGLYDLNICMQTVCSNESCKAEPCDMDLCIFGNSPCKYIPTAKTDMKPIKQRTSILPPASSKYIHSSFESLPNSAKTNQNTQRSVSQRSHTSTL